MALSNTRYRRVEAATIDRRSAPRWHVQVSSQALCRSGDISITAELHDISVFGCRLRVDNAFSEGEEVHISLGDYEPVIATAVWQQGHELGCRFLHPIDTQILRSVTIGD